MNNLKEIKYFAVYKGTPIEKAISEAKEIAKAESCIAVINYNDIIISVLEDDDIQKRVEFYHKTLKSIKRSKIFNRFALIFVILILIIFCIILAIK